MTDDIEEDAHSERGPSTAHRWRPCPASVRLSRGLPNTAGIEAAYGTVFHEVAALCLEFDLDPFGFVGFTMDVAPHGDIEFTTVMAGNMMQGLTLARSLMTPGSVVLVERRVSLEDWVGPGEFGTTDLAIIDVKNRRIVIFDWKYGAGVPVHPEKNDQAILYFLGTWSSHAAGLFWQYEAEQAELRGQSFDDNMPWEDDIAVTVIIEQPRAPGGGGVWETTVGDLLNEGLKIREDAALTEDPDAPIRPGTKQCQFCLAARYGTCKARAVMLLDLAKSDFDSIETASSLGVVMPMLPPSAFTPEERSAILLHRPMFEALFEDLHRMAYHDAEKGRPVPGLKMVDGRAGPRSWKDPQKASIVLTSRLGTDAYEPKKLISPAKAEEAIGKKEFALVMKPFVTQSESKPILVPEADKRAALPTSQDDFNEAETLTLI